MQYDYPYESLLHFLTSTAEGVIFKVSSTTDDVVKILPDGWKNLLGPVFLITQNLDDVFLSIVKVEKGLLRAYAGGRDDLIDLVERVSQSVARESAVICMVCGHRGVRRKHEPYSPSLCEMHYIQYINWLDKNGYHDGRAGNRDQD